MEFLFSFGCRCMHRTFPVRNLVISSRVLPWLVHLHWMEVLPDLRTRLDIPSLPPFVVLGTFIRWLPSELGFLVGLGL